MPYLTALENVTIPALYTDMPVAERQTRAKYLLTRLGLGDRINYRPAQLSGGQQQRVSIARALMNGAPVILADEPTGALDSTSGQELMAILHGLHQAGHTLIIVTHDRSIAEQCQRIVEIRDGRIIADRANPVISQVVSQGLPAIAATGRTSVWQSIKEAVRMAGALCSGIGSAPSFHAGDYHRHLLRGHLLWQWERAARQKYSPAR